MKSPSTNPHDEFFKVAFSRQDVVEEYIQQFLTQGLVQNIDFQSLAISNNSYISDQLEEYFADVVWECSYGAARKPIKIAFLFEHKSYVPKFPHLQLLRYMLEIWEDCDRNKLPLTPVVPIVVYHNADPKRHWRYRPFADYFKETDEFLLPYIPTFDYQLTDLTSFSKEAWQMLKAGLLLNSLRTLRFGGDEKYVLQNAELMFVSVGDPEKKESLETFFVAQLVYILKNNEFSPADVYKIIQTVKKTTNMSSYDHLIQEAKKEGIDNGIEKGIEKGANQKEREVIANILAQFPNWDDEKIANLATSTLEIVRAVRTELGL